MIEIETLIVIQDMLLNINSETIETTLHYIINSIFNSFENFNLLLNIIFEIVYKRRNLRIYLSLICKKISESRKNAKNRHEFKHFFLSKFLKIDNNDLGRIHSHINFYYLCMKQNFLTEDDIINQMYSSCKSEMVSISPSIVYYLLLYFAPILKEKNNDFYIWLCNQFEYNIKKVTDFSKSLLRHWGHLPERLFWITPFIIENWQKIIEKVEWIERETVLTNGFLDDSVESLIVNDKYFDLQDYVTKNQLEIDEFKCYDYFLVFQELFDLNEICMLQVASVFNSVKCFKYLILNSSKPDSFYNEKKLMNCSIKGGNPEIIRLLHQKKFKIDNECLNLSFLFFHFDVFQWLYQMKNQDQIELIMSTIENESLLSFSLDSLQFFYQNEIKQENESENEEFNKLIKMKISNEAKT